MFIYPCNVDHGPSISNSVLNTNVMTDGNFIRPGQ